MITRTIHTGIWKSELFRALDKDGKLVYSYLLTNEYASLSGVFKVSDLDIVIHTGVSEEDLERVFEQLKAMNKVGRYKDWVYIVGHDKYNKYTGSSNQIARDRQLKEAPLRQILQSLNSETLVSTLESVTDSALPVQNDGQVDESEQGSPYIYIINNIYNYINIYNSENWSSKSLSDGAKAEGVHTSPRAKKKKPIGVAGWTKQRFLQSIELIEIEAMEKFGETRKVKYALDYFVNAIAAKNYGYTNYKQAFFNWLRDDKYGNFAKSGVRKNGSINSDTDKYHGK